MTFLLAGAAGGQFGKDVAFFVDVDVGEAELLEAVEEPGGAGGFAEGWGGDADDVELPLAELRLVEMEPVEGAMDRGECGQARDAALVVAVAVIRFGLGVGKAVVLCTIPHPSQKREGWGTRIVGADGVGCMTGTAFVFDLDEEEAAGGCGGAGGGAVAGGEDGGDVVGGDAAGGCFDEGADEVANHVVEETGAGDSVDEEAVAVVPGGVVDGADVVLELVSSLRSR